MNQAFSRNLIFVFFITIGLQACMDVTQEISINKDSSGKLSISAELPKSKILDFLSPLVDMPVNAEYEKMAKTITSELNKMKGISDAIYLNDKRNNRVSLSCRFQNSEDMNKALYAIGGGKKRPFYPAYIKVRKNRIKINDVLPYMKKFYITEYNNLIGMIPQGIIKYHFVIQVPGQIKNFSNPAYTISPDAKSVSMHCMLDELILLKIRTGCKIKFED